MAQRRMFSPQIIDSDAFLDMPTSAQSLYFHLGMRADDDGFVGNPKRIMKTVGGNEDDLKILIGKRFVLVFETGVIVIKHWRINNLVRKDWYKETVYLEEKNQLRIKENGSYTELVNENATTRSRRLGKVRLGKININIVQPSADDLDSANLLKDLIKQNLPTFKDPDINKWALEINKISRIDGYTKDQIDYVIRWCQNNDFWQGNILSPQKLRKQFVQLIAQIKRGESKKKQIGNNERVLHDGSRAIKKFGTWYSASQPDVKIDLHYYPELLKD